MTERKSCSVASASRRAPEPADVVHEEVHPAEHPHRPADERVDPLCRREVAGERGVGSGAGQPRARASVAASPSRPRAPTATHAPSCASARAMAFPIPRLAPVTTATLPESPRSMRTAYRGPRPLTREARRPSTGCGRHAGAETGLAGGTRGGGARPPQPISRPWRGEQPLVLRGPRPEPDALHARPLPRPAWRGARPRSRRPPRRGVRSTRNSRAGESSIAIRSAQAEAPSNAPCTARTSASPASQRTMSAPVTPKI